jgi:hypothetical protein
MVEVSSKRYHSTVEPLCMDSIGTILDRSSVSLIERFLPVRGVQ